MIELAIQEAFRKTDELLRLRNNSRRTRDAYLSCLGSYLKQGGSATSCDSEHIRTFLLNRFEKGSAAQTVTLHFNAIRFYYREVLGQSINIPWRTPRRPQKLPVVLSRAEIEQLLGTKKIKSTISFSRLRMVRD